MKIVGSLIFKIFKKLEPPTRSIYMYIPPNIGAKSTFFCWKNAFKMKF